MLNTENSKIQANIASLVKIAKNQEDLKEFVKSYFMTYDSNQSQWKENDFKEMINSLTAMKDLKGVSGQSKADISQVISAFVGMDKVVRKEYKENRSTAGKLYDYLLPPKKLPEAVQNARNVIEEIKTLVGKESTLVERLEKQGAQKGSPSKGRS